MGEMHKFQVSFIGWGHKQGGLKRNLNVAVTMGRLICQGL